MPSKEPRLCYAEEIEAHFRLKRGQALVMVELKQIPFCRLPTGEVRFVLADVQRYLSHEPIRTRLRPRM